MPDSRSSKSPYDFVSALANEPGDPHAVEALALLPALNDPYKAAGFADRERGRLVLVMGRDGFRIGQSAYVALQYVHMGIGEFGFTADGQVFRFLFSDLQPKLVTVQGRNLQRIFDHISLRRVPWIRQADRDFRGPDGAADSDPVITRIACDDWKPRPGIAASLPEALDAHPA